MYVPEIIFERKPILGVILGVIGFAFGLVGYYFIETEYRGWGKTPEAVDLKTVTPPPELHGKWAVVRQPLKIHCASVEVENQLEHQLLFGRVQSTYFLAEVEGSQRFVILERHKRAVCDDLKRGPFIGVPTEVNSRLRSTLESRGMVFPYQRLTMLLCLSCGPQDAKIYLTFFPLFMAMCAWLTVRMWRKHQQLQLLRRGSAWQQTGEQSPL